MKRSYRRASSWLLLLALLISRLASAAQGDFDPTFGDGGRVRFSLPGASVGLIDFIVQSDGKIVGLGRTPWVVTSSSAHELFVVRFNANGSLDTSFNVVGYKLIDFNGGLDLPGCIRQQTDGKLIITGRADSSPGNGDFVVIRLNANGSVDQSFGNAGFAFVDFGGDAELAQRAIIQPDGAIVLMGFVTTGSSSDFAFARLTSSGALDTSFGTLGKIQVDVLGNGAVDRPGNFLLQSDGKFIAVGGADSFATVLRLNANGTLDTSLNGTGKLALPLIAPVVSASAIDVAQHTDGGLVLLTSVSTSSGMLSQPAVLRINSAGSIQWPYALVDPTVTGSPSPGSINSLAGLAIDASGSIFVAGTFTTFNFSTSFAGAGVALTYRAFVAKVSDYLILSTGTTAVLDPTFGYAGVALIDTGAGDDGADHDAARIRLQADGRAIVGGFQTGVINKPASLFLSRLLNTGAFPGVLSIDAPGDVRSATSQPGLNEEITVAEGSSLNVRVWRSGGTAGAVSVQYALIGQTATAAVDFTANTGTLTWADGDRTLRTISLATLNNGAYNGVNKTLRIALSNPTGGAILGTSTAQATIRNINAATIPTVSFSGASRYVNEAETGTSSPFRSLAITRSGDAGGTASVDYTFVDGSAHAGTDFIAASGTITWAPGDAAAKYVTFALKGDNRDESDENFTVHLSNPFGVLIAQADLLVTINDCDPSPFVEFTQPSLTVNESAKSVTAMVSRVGNSTQPLTVDYQTQAGSAATGDFLAASGTLTWAANDLSPKPVVITLVDDTAVESAETFSIQLSNATGGGVIGQNTVSIQIVDDDTAAPPAPSPSPTPTPPSSPAPTSSSSSGGGAMPLNMLWLLCLLGFRRRLSYRT